MGSAVGYPAVGYRLDAPAADGSGMKNRRTGALALLLTLVLPACGTVNGVRWAYGESSIYDEPDSYSEKLAVRATFGLPVIVGGAAFDAVTWPVQLLFGVWPMWGGASKHMVPE